MSQTVAVLGAGSWGTALAIHLARVGHEVRLWGRDCALVEEMSKRRANAVYLADVNFPAALTTTHSLDAALGGAGMVVLAVPSHGLRHVLDGASAFVSADALVVSATKGLEEQTLLRMSQVVTLAVPTSANSRCYPGPASQPNSLASCRRRWWSRQRRTAPSNMCSTSFGQAPCACTAVQMWSASKSAAL